MLACMTSTVLLRVFKPNRASAAMHICMGWQGDPSTYTVPPS